MAKTATTTRATTNRVQRVLRHRDVTTTTRTYAHLLAEDLREAVNALPALPAARPA